ncbi:hypothetical protein BTVI_67215 [Pitangus sulphuratus]|nr:hypothetical protein BTVI_67215 [Pitangus sulphuratus]
MIGEQGLAVFLRSQLFLLRVAVTAKDELFNVKPRVSQARKKVHCIHSVLAMPSGLWRDFDELEKWNTKVVTGLEHTTHKQRLGEPNFSGLEKRCQKGKISDIYMNFWVVVEKVEPEMLSDGKSSRHRLQLEKFQLDLTFFVLRVIVYWDNLPKESESFIPFIKAGGGSE